MTAILLYTNQISDSIEATFFFLFSKLHSFFLSISVWMFIFNPRYDTREILRDISVIMYSQEISRILYLAALSVLQKYCLHVSYFWKSAVLVGNITLMKGNNEDIMLSNMSPLYHIQNVFISEFISSVDIVIKVSLFFNCRFSVRNFMKYQQQC